MGIFLKSNTVVRSISCFCIALSLAGVFFLHVLAMVFTPRLNHDAAAYLTAGQMIVGGARPYVDIIDTNFPMIMYISAIPAGLSRLTHVPLAVAGSMFFFCAAIFTMLLFGKILKITFPELTRQEIQFVYIAWLYTSFIIYSANEFGQREHLIFLCIAPFLVLRHARYLHARIPLYLSALTAGIAFCAVAIKPFFVLPILAIDMLQAIANRRFRKPLLSPETGVFVLFGVLYMAHFYFFSGMAAFYDYWLGFVTRGYVQGGAYGIGAQATMRTLQQLPFFYVYCVVAVFLSVLFLYDKDKRPLFFLSSCFGWFACCSLALFIWQKKGFFYHLLPFYYSCYMGGALFCLGCKRLFVANKDIYMPLLACAAALMMLTYYYAPIPYGVNNYPQPFDLLRAPFTNAPLRFPKNDIVTTIERETEPNDSVLFLDTRMWPGFPSLTYTGRKLGGRFLVTFPLAVFFSIGDSNNYVPRQELQQEEAMFYKMIEEDIDAIRPKLIFIKRGGLQATDFYFRLPEYLKRKGLMEKIASSYLFIGLVGEPNLAGNKNFEVWRYK